MEQSLSLKSDLGTKLRASAFSGNEQLGHLFGYQLYVVSDDGQIDMRKLLGTSMTVTLTSPDSYKRYFNGIVSEISQVSFEIIDANRYARYSVTLVPKAWLLSQKIDSRIYKNMSVPDIVKKVLNEFGYTDVILCLSGSYPPREYCVQYREDYLNFISRLMEQEGIYYFFRHVDGAHKMTLADALGAHSPTPTFDELRYQPNAQDQRTTGAGIQDFYMSRSVQTTKYTLTDYDPLKPKASLTTPETISQYDQAHAVTGLESFDFPGDHQIAGDGSRYAKVKIEALNVAQASFHGTSDVFGIMTGALYKLKDFPRNELNQEYLVTGSTVSVQDADPHSGDGDEGNLFSCSFSAIESRRPFRTLHHAVRPVVIGLQTAVVCGSKEAEDIVVDKYGRVQVIFFWNKTDKENHDVSCPVRVSTPWAGKQWGAVHIPRVGQEVVVSFLEGDPDRPLIVGSVYNADNMPPYDLPANMTQSGIKSRSHKGGGAANFNEIRFEDKMGSEELFMHAEKDMREEVEHDHFVDIGNDETLKIKINRTHDIGQEDKLTVGANSTTDVKQKYKLTAGTEIELITGASSIKMTSAGDIEIKGVNIKINGSLSVKVDGGVSTDVSAGAAMNVKGGATTTVKAPMLTLTGDAIAKLGGGITIIG